jgi:ADP-ribose pyrophosphatase
LNDREVLAQGRHVRLVRDQGWEYVERNTASGIVVLVAVTPDERLVLVEQFRIPVGGVVVELPAGLAGDVAGHESEALTAAAQRELLEETGYEAGSLERLAEGPPSAGITSEVVTFFRATSLRRVGPGGGDGTERITVHEVPLAEADRWLRERMRAGVLVDPKVFAGLHLFRA